jgi:hypothetical protein
VRWPAAGLGHRPPLNHASLHEPIQPLANRRGRHAEMIGQLADAQRLVSPQKVHDRRV